ncbi:MAG: Ig-like domain-containing protein [Candidatus Gracilibacteria bacterium]
MTKIDKLFGIVASVLLFIVLGLILGGDHTVPKVMFSHAEKTITPKTSQLSFTFNREMDKNSVESGFTLTPSVEGTFSWSGKKAAFTLSKPLEYTTNYTLSLKNVIDKNGVPLPAYESAFNTRSPLLSYIGTENEEKRKIILYDLNTKIKQILPTNNLDILSIYPHPSGRYLLFFAVDPSAATSTSLEEYQELYSINLETKIISKLADNKGFRNSALSISPDGSLLIIRRIELDEHRLVSRSDHLWMASFLSPEWKKFWYTAGNPPVHFTPDGRSVLVWNIREGFMLLPISQGDSAPEQIGNFERSFGFSPDGSKALFTEFEMEGTTRNFNHVVAFYNKGEKMPLLKNTGSIMNPSFSKNGRFFYYVMMRKEDNTLGAPLFHLYAYDFDKNAVRAITQDPNFSEEHFAISPDETQVVFERFPYLSTENKGIDHRPLLEAAEKSYAGAELWSYETNTMGGLKNLGIKGRSPKWVE